MGDCGFESLLMFRGLIWWLVRGRWQQRVRSRCIVGLLGSSCNMQYAVSSSTAQPSGRMTLVFRSSEARATLLNATDANEHELFASHKLAAF